MAKRLADDYASLRGVLEGICKTGRISLLCGGGKSHGPPRKALFTGAKNMLCMVPPGKLADSG